MFSIGRFVFFVFMNSCLHDGNAKPRFGQLVHLCLVLFASAGIHLQTSFLVHCRTDANIVSCVFCLFAGCVLANMALVKTRSSPISVVMRLVCTFAEEFFVGQPLFRGILSVLRIRVRHWDVSFFCSVSRNAFCCVALTSVDLHRWTKETLDAGSCFDQGSESLPSGNGCTLI